MNRPLTLLAALLLVSLPLAAQAPDSAARIGEAIALVDSGKVDEAIVKLKAVLAAEPGNETASYELGLAYAAKGDNAQCRAMFEPLSAVAGPNQASSLTMLGTCLDHLGEHEKAIDAYRRGVKLAPDDASLLFNLSVTLAQRGQLDEVRSLMENSTRKNPWHASSHLLLARVFDAQGFRLPGVMAYLHFLALEPSSARSADAAKLMQVLLRLGVTTSGKGGANITIDPNSRTEEGDYKAMEMMLALVTAGEGLEKKQRLSEFEKAQGSIVTTLAIFLESKDQRTDYTSTVQVPFFTAIQNEKLLEPFAAVALSSLNLRGGEAWMKKHAAEVTRYRAWIGPQTAKQAVPLRPPQ